MKNKKDCVVFYTGGFSHLAYLAALEAGCHPVRLVYFDGAEKHPEYFGDQSRADLMRLHAGLLGEKLDVYPMPKNLLPGGKVPDMSEILGILRESVEFGTLVTGSTPLRGGQAKMNGIAAACARLGLKALFPLAGMTLPELVGKAGAAGCSFRVTAAAGSGAAEILGQDLDPALAGTIAEHSSPRERCGFQVTALRSPAFRGQHISLRQVRTLRKNGISFISFKPAKIAG